jgi:hypothetical protein
MDIRGGDRNPRPTIFKCSLMESGNDAIILLLMIHRPFPDAFAA